MSSASHRSFHCAVLLVAAVTWLVSVTLCAGRVLPEAPHEHPVASEHSDHAHGPTHDHGDKQPDDGCTCASFKSFPALTLALAKAPVPAVSPLLYSVVPEEFNFESVGISVTTQNTGPPGRRSPAEWILERCLLNHAPPFVV